MNPQMFEQMTQQFGSLFGGIDKSNMKQAENIWKMLDEMSQNNPEQYKQFVDQNIKDGFKNLEEEHKQKIDGQKVMPNIGFLIKTQAILRNQILDKEHKDIFQKLIVKENNVLNYQEFKKKCDKEVKFYINVLFHSRVKGPLDENMKVVKDFQNYNSWKIVPVSTSQVASRKSESYGTNVYFIDVIVNDKVYEFMNSQVQLQVNLIKFITDRVQDEIRTKHNPLLEFYNPSEVNELMFYQFEKMSLKRHTKKLYKHVEKKYKSPQPLLIEPQYDIDYQKNQKNLRKEQEKIDELKNKAKDMKNNPQQAFTQPQPQQEQKPMMQPEDLLKQMTQQGQQPTSSGSQNEEKVLDGLRLVDKSEVQQKKQEPKKPVLIQELSSTENIEPEVETKKEVQKKQQQQQPQQKQAETLEQKKERIKQQQLKEAELQIQQEQEAQQQKIKEPEYIMHDSDKFYIKIDIKLPDVKSAKQINLDISSKELKLQVVDLYMLNLKFSYIADNGDVQTKWEKKTKTLKLTIAKKNN